MKRIKSILIFFTVFLMAILSVNADYTFKIEADHDFDESDFDEIECEVEYDDKKRSWNFDEDSDSEEREFERDFEEKMELDCNEKVDELEFRVFDNDGDKVYDEDFNNEDRFDYELDVADKDDDWFRIDITHSFGQTEEIDCRVSSGGEKSVNYEFDKDSSSDDLRIERNYENSIDFDCDRDVDEIELTVFDDDGDEVFERTYEDETGFDYDEDQDPENELRIELNHDFDGDEVDCTLEIDNDETQTYTFDDDSSGNDLRVVRFFYDEFEFDCNDNIDKFEVDIYDKGGDRVDSFEVTRDDSFDYEFDIKKYDAFIEITHAFTDDEVDCDLNIDGESRPSKEFEFDDSSSLGDLRIDDEFDSTIEFRCKEDLDEFLLIVFESDNDGDGDELDRKVYTNTNGFDYRFGDGDQVIQELDKVEEVEAQEEEEEKEDESTPQKNEATVVEPELTEIGSSAGNDVAAAIDGDLGDNEQTSGSEEVDDTATEEIEASGENVHVDSGVTVVLIIAIFVIIAFIVLLMFISPKHFRKKRR